MRKKQGVIDMLGTTHNGCEVISREESNERGLAMWRVRCFCGNEFNTSGASIRNGRTKSCGCTRNTWAKKMGKMNRTHGETRTRLYVIWKNMKSRCYDTAHKSYKYYGGRGIEVCNEWIDSYESFRNWANLNGYTDDLTIDRIDNNEHYTPNNCQWADTKTQQRNTRRNVYVLYEGKLLTKAEVREKTGLTKYLLDKQILNGVFVKQSDL